MAKVKGWGKGYSTGMEIVTIEINGFQTAITTFVKDGIDSTYIYCIRNKNNEFVEFDVRSFDNFPSDDSDALIANWATMIKNHIAENPSSYSRYID